MMSTDERLVYMANQIARNLATLGADAAVAVADHIARFWDPRMRAQILAMHRLGVATLDPVAEAAIRTLRDHGAPPHQNGATEFNSVDGLGHSDAG